MRLVTATFRPGLAATIGRDRGRCADDLLEVVENEKQTTILDMRDETLLEVTLAVEEPERARDCANHVSGVPHGLECPTTTPSV